MISKLAGFISKKNTKTKTWWIKLAVCLVLSNVLFFMLFSGDETQVVPTTENGLVEVQLNANLMTPFQEGKKVLLIQRASRNRIEGVLKSSSETGFIVSVTEENALALIQTENWEILPYLKDFKFRDIARGEGYEIRY